jgi:hypothetical protein
MSMPSSSATAELTEHFNREFTPELDPDVVEAEVATAERELRGQVPPGSLEELMHRLVGWRLRQRAGGRS